MDEIKVERVCKPEVIAGGEEGNQRKLVVGGDWLRVSYERRDGRIQVQYLLFDSRGYVHTFVDGAVSAETERRHNDVASASGHGRRIVRVGLDCPGGWAVTVMGREIHVSGG